jgi:AcrR family transcriptional regulator
LVNKDTRRRILEAATMLIAERGVAGLRIRAVARAVGIREGSIYNHFAGRGEIIKEVFQGVDASLSPLGAILDLKTTPADSIDRTREFIHANGLGGFLAGSRAALLDGFMRNPLALRVTRAVLSARFHDPDARRAYQDVFLQDLRRVFGTVCQLAAEAGRLKPSVRPEALAMVLVAVFEHALGEVAGDGDIQEVRARLDEPLGAIIALVAN